MTAKPAVQRRLFKPGMAMARKRWQEARAVVKNLEADVKRLKAEAQDAREALKEAQTVERDAAEELDQLIDDSPQEGLDGVAGSTK
jgi:outer membrane protein TolC